MSESIHMDKELRYCLRCGSLKHEIKACPGFLGSLFETAKEITSPVPAYCVNCTTSADGYCSIHRPLAAGNGLHATIVLLAALKADVLEIVLSTPAPELKDKIMQAFVRYEQKIQAALR